MDLREGDIIHSVSGGFEFEIAPPEPEYDLEASRAERQRMEALLARSLERVAAAEAEVQEAREAQEAAETEQLERQIERLERERLELLGKAARRAEIRAQNNLVICKAELLNAKAQAASEFGRIMYMPAGTHLLHCGFGYDSSAEIWVTVQPATAGVIQDSFVALNRKHAPQRILFDFEHQEKEALAWPVRFFWSETPQPGVYADVEFTSLGSEYIKGKVVRSFSPSFVSDGSPKHGALRRGTIFVPSKGARGSEENPASITSLSFPCAGGFTNNPAFHAIMPLWAKDSRAAD